MPEEVVRGIITTRSIASQHRSMNYDVFWDTLTIDLPTHLKAWRAATRG